MRKLLVTTQHKARSCLGIESSEIDISDQTTLDESLIEATDGDNELKQISQETHVLFTRIAALEDLAEVIETQIKEATPAEAVLVDIATDLAVSDTDVQEDDITPGLESAIGKQIATEGVKDTASRFLNAVIDKISNGLDHMLSWVRSIPAMIRIAKRQIKQLAEASLTIDETVQGSFKIGAKLKVFCVGGKIPTTQKEIVNAVNSIKSDIVQLYGPTLTEIENMHKAAFSIQLHKSGDEGFKQLIDVYAKSANVFTKLKTKGKLDSSVLLKHVRGGDILCDFGNTGIASSWTQIAAAIKSNESPQFISRMFWDGHGFNYTFNTRGYDNLGTTRTQLVDQELPVATKAELKQMLDSTLVIVDLLDHTLTRLEKFYNIKASFKALSQDDRLTLNTELIVARVGRMRLHFNTANALLFSAKECLWLASAVFKLAAKSIAVSGSKAPVIENIEV